VSKCLTTLSLAVFTQRNFVADFLQVTCDFTPKTTVRVFEPHLGSLEGGLRGNIRYHLRHTGKLTADFLLVLIELFSLGVTTEALRANISSISAISLQMGPVTAPFPHSNKMLSYRRETTLQGASVLAKSVEDWNWETIFYIHYRSVPTTVT